VNAFALYPPHEKDVKHFSKFIVGSADSARSTDAGMEKAIAVLKWWQILLRRRWWSWEHAHESEETSPDMAAEEKVGRAWWKSFNQVKEEVDIVARKKFGGSISLK